MMQMHHVLQPLRLWYQNIATVVSEYCDGGIRMNRDAVRRFLAPSRNDVHRLCGEPTIRCLAEVAGVIELRCQLCWCFPGVSGRVDRIWWLGRLAL